MKTVARTIAASDAARIKASLMDAGVRYAEQRDGDDTTLIFLACDAQAASDTIAKELER